MAIEVAYQPTFRDFLSLNRWIVRRTWRPFRILSIGLIAVYVAGPFLFHDLGAEGLLRPYVQSLALLILPAVILVVLPAKLHLEAKRQWNAAPEIREPRRFVFSEDGILVEGASFSGRVAWSHITAAATHRGLVLLKTNQNLYYLLSESGFTDDDRRQAFASLVRKKVSPAFGRHSLSVPGRIRFLEAGGNSGRDA